MASEISAVVLGKALDGLFLRQIVTAQNIANVNSPAYMPMQVTFEAALAQAWEASSRAGERALHGVQPEIVAAVTSAPEQAVRVDQEIITAAETSMRYAMLVSVIDRGLQLKSLAVTGGAR